MGDLYVDHLNSAAGLGIDHTFNFTRDDISMFSCKSSLWCLWDDFFFIVNHPFFVFVLLGSLDP